MAGDDILAAARHAGGVPEALWRDAPPLSEVVAHVRTAIAGCRIVGHGLGKDLAALGIEHPRCGQLSSQLVKLHRCCTPCANNSLPRRQHCMPNPSSRRCNNALNGLMIRHIAWDNSPHIQLLCVRRGLQVDTVA